MKKIVYTVLIGDYDEVYHLNEWNPNSKFELYIITDKKRNELLGTAFKQIIAPKIFNNNSFNSRYYKFHPFELINGDEYFYFDANREINSTFAENIFATANKSSVDLIHFLHPKNTDYHGELLDCLKQKKINDYDFRLMQLSSHEVAELCNSGVLSENSFIYFNSSFRVKLYLSFILGLYITCVKRDQLASMLASNLISTFSIRCEYLTYEKFGYLNKYKSHKKKKISFWRKLKIKLWN